MVFQFPRLREARLIHGAYANLLDNPTRAPAAAQDRHRPNFRSRLWRIAQPGVRLPTRSWECGQDSGHRLAIRSAAQIRVLSIHLQSGSVHAHLKRKLPGFLFSNFATVWPIQRQEQFAAWNLRSEKVDEKDGRLCLKKGSGSYPVTFNGYILTVERWSGSFC